MGVNENRLFGRHGFGEVSREVDVDAVHDCKVWHELSHRYASTKLTV